MFLSWVSLLYFSDMFVRKKKNKSGVISIQIIDKSSGSYQVYRTMGSSDEATEVDRLFKEARKEIERITGQQKLPFETDKEKEFVDTFFHGIEDFKLVGPELVLGKLFDEVGFNKIPDELFRHLVITRLVYPVSKLKTVDYIFKYKGDPLQIQNIYRYLDKLKEKQIDQIQQISYQHTLKILEGHLSIVFYDVTTLYFEASDEDDFRKAGFSKDGKHQQPQIVLGLLVSEQGYPLVYEVFDGSTFEGHTMLPVIETFKKKYQLEKLVIVADAGLLSSKNIEALIDQNYEFILGARLKNESRLIQQKTLNLHLEDGQSSVINKEGPQKLVVSYSAQRAKKDAFNRKRGLQKLEKALSAGRLTKQHINNKGYNKYLKLDGQINISIDYDKFNDDVQWDGLKGYLTNAKLSKEAVIDSYKQLWFIEKAFRISKTDLRIRPIFHYRKRRILAHICIAFTAYKIYKELERQLNNLKAGLSPEKAIDILKTIYSLTIVTPYSETRHTRLLIKTKEQENLLKLFDRLLVSPC
jgi:transposase